MNSKSVSIVIPTFSARALLEKNLPSVEKLLRANDELVIVDDASSDDSVTWLIDRYRLEPTGTSTETNNFSGKTSRGIPVKVLVNLTNVRFGQTANRGIQAASKEIVFLLNNDVQPEVDVFIHALPHFSDTAMFAVGCHELEGSQPVISGGKKKLWFAQGLFQHSRAEEFSSGPTDWVSGGSSFFDRAKWLQLGGFDQAFYPAYWEDVDISYRATKKGWKLWFEAKAMVHHNHESTNQTVFGQLKIEDMSWKNGQTFLWKHAHGAQILAALAWWPVWQWRHYQARQKLLKRV